MTKDKDKSVTVSGQHEVSIWFSHLLLKNIVTGLHDTKILKIRRMI